MKRDRIEHRIAYVETACMVFASGNHEPDEFGARLRARYLDHKTILEKLSVEELADYYYAIFGEEEI